MYTALFEARAQVLWVRLALPSLFFTADICKPACPLSLSIVTLCRCNRKKKTFKGHERDGRMPKTCSKKKRRPRQKSEQDSIDLPFSFLVKGLFFPSGSFSLIDVRSFLLLA